MNHHGAVLLVVSAGIFEFEAFGQVVVHLNGTELPATAEGVLHHEVELRTVESGFAVFDAGRQAFFFASLDNGVFGLFPVFFRTDILLAVHLVAQGNLCLKVFEVEGLEDNHDDVHHTQELVLYLVRTAEDVRVVLGKAAHTRQSVQLTALFVTVHGAELCEAQGQVLITAGLPSVNGAVVRAVHGLEHILLAFFGRVDRLERVFAILGIVSGSDVEVLRADVRRHHLLVAVALLDFLQEILEAQAERGAFRQPHGQALAYEFGEHEEFHFLANLAVVAALGFFEELEVFVEELLFRETDTVNAGHLRAFLVAAPIGGAYSHYFHGFDGCGVHQVRAAAEVGVRALRVRGDMSVFELCNKFVFIGLPVIAEEFERVVLRYALAHKGFLAGNELLHLLLDFREIAFADADALRRHHVVVETVFNGGADTELRAGPKFLHGFCHEVGRGVPKGVLAFCVVPFI